MHEDIIYYWRFLPNMHVAQTTFCFWLYIHDRGFSILLSFTLPLAYFHITKQNATPLPWCRIQVNYMILSSILKKYMIFTYFFLLKCTFKKNTYVIDIKIDGDNNYLRNFCNKHITVSFFDELKVTSLLLPPACLRNCRNNKFLTTNFYINRTSIVTASFEQAVVRMIITANFHHRGSKPAVKTILYNSIFAERYNCLACFLSHKHFLR
jgi:hypothetical protein